MNNQNDEKKNDEARVFLGAYGLADALKKYGIDLIAEVLAKELNSKRDIAKRAPTTCVLWDDPERVRRLSFDQIKRYTDDDHLIHDLLKCTECGQLYFKEFYEEIDWVNGEDPQYRTYIPVENEERAEELNKLNPFELCSITPHLQDDWPSSGERTTKWIGRELPPEE